MSCPSCSTFSVVRWASSDRARSFPIKSGSSRKKCPTTDNVEDWFHILELPSTPDLHCWDALPSFVESNFLKLMDLLSEESIQATCFFLGWVAKRFPWLVAEAGRRGHEIASHGYAHRLAWCMTPDEFLEDLRISKANLEAIVGKPALGYREAGFSVRRETPRCFQKVV